jgi:hypothetical protein
MKYQDFLGLVHDLAWFDLPTLARISNEPRQTLKMQLSRWAGQGKVVSIRRGMYALGKNYRRSELNPAVLANQLYRPSYLSFLWALGYYGLIPEKVVLFTSATSRAPAEFENAFGRFRYTHIKQSAFAGYQPLAMDRLTVLVALPEKALLDYWHAERGEWSVERMRSMRFQNCGMVTQDVLSEQAGRFCSPRLNRAILAWKRYVQEEAEGSREL